MIVAYQQTKIHAIEGAFVDATKGKIGIFGYYFGIVLAFSGMLAEAATETLTGEMLLWAERAAIAISVAGMGYSLWQLKRDISTEAHEKAVPLITMIELAIGICGVVSATAKYLSDAGGS